MLRFTDCNSVLVSGQMVSEAHETGSAAVSLHHYKAACRSNIIIYRGKAITLRCDQRIQAFTHNGCIIRTIMVASLHIVSLLSGMLCLFVDPVITKERD